MRIIFLILFLANTSYAVDMFKIAHLESVNSIPACNGAMIVQIQQIKGCQQFPEICKGGQVCVALLTNAKVAAVCNPTPNTSYNYCE